MSSDAPGVVGHPNRCVTVSKALQLESFGHAHCEWLVDQGGLARRHNLDYVFRMTVVGSRDDGGIYFVVGQTSLHRVGASPCLDANANLFSGDRLKQLTISTAALRAAASAWASAQRPVPIIPNPVRSVTPGSSLTATCNRPNSRGDWTVPWR
jgi:hypothetical protein